jgi:hypothetical protein
VVVDVCTHLFPSLLCGAVAPLLLVYHTCESFATLCATFLDSAPAAFAGRVWGGKARR